LPDQLALVNLILNR